MRFDGDIIITDPCYITKDHKDWEKCSYGDNMAALGIQTHITRNTIYGDWSCTTFELKKPLGRRFPSRLKDGNARSSASCDFTDNVLGRFCADAGMVSVFLLEEVLRYNSSFKDHLNKKWTTTWIKDFHGEVEDVVDNNQVYIVGTGNVNFITTQTGA